MRNLASTSTSAWLDHEHPLTDTTPFDLRSTGRDPGICARRSGRRRSVNPPTDTTPVYDIPFARGISIDGDGADWKEAGFRVEFMPDMNGITQPQASFEPKFRLAWDKRGLLLLLKVRDDIIVESADESLLGEQDSAEVFVGAGRGSCEYYSLVLVPGITPALPGMRVKPIDLRKKDPRAPLSYEAARTKSADGYVLEARDPGAAEPFAKGFAGWRRA